VEVGDGRVLLREVVVAADDAAAVTHDAHDAAVLPVADLLLVGPLEARQELLHSSLPASAISSIWVTKLGQGPVFSSSNNGILLWESAIGVSLFGLE
jgi:hypothetical protein